MRSVSREVRQASLFCGAQGLYLSLILASFVVRGCWGEGSRRQTVAMLRPAPVWPDLEVDQCLFDLPSKSAALEGDRQHRDTA